VDFNTKRFQQSWMNKTRKILISGLVLISSPVTFGFIFLSWDKMLCEEISRNCPVNVACECSGTTLGILAILFYTIIPFLGIVLIGIWYYLWRKNRKLASST